MYKIDWDKPLKSSKSGLAIDIGDIRLILIESSNYWPLDMGIRAYDSNREISMVRPPVNVMRISKPCDLEEAKIRTEEYLNQFLTSIINSSIINSTI